MAVLLGIETNGQLISQAWKWQFQRRPNSTPERFDQRCEITKRRVSWWSFDRAATYQ